MTEAERIADQHRRAFDGEAWHGPHVFDVLDGITAAKAAKKPIPKAHSIWEIVLHMAAWEEVVLSRIRGEPIELSSAQDWPEVSDTSRSAWIRALASLREGYEELQSEMEKLPDARLFETPPRGGSPLYRLLHGQVQHALYHAGQIAVLKK